MKSRAQNTIQYDSRSRIWVNDVDVNFERLRIITETVIGKLKKKGSLYLDEIYDCFGCAWDPSLENKVIGYSDKKELIRYIRCGDKNEFTIFIN